jgi:tetratricopeptide (TPR) repeat protein
MRLLKLEDDGSLTFTKDLASDIPPYAILSHTWGDDEEELTFRDIKKGRGKDKDGWAKIEFCVKQASADGLGYLWIDTCCIDKSNQMELQHAINSMFRWYQNSAKCYVYLPDVPMEGLPEETWKTGFRKTRWATRGWTLQELIAPSCVEFFSSEGQKLGDKRSLESLLHDMTGISIRALRGTPLCEFTELERMSWIEQRQTKYPEDKAYALLGMFDILMPVIYGEGHRNAFARLREAIALHTGRGRPTTDYSKPHVVVPVSRNADFVGRGDILDKLLSMIPPETNDSTCQMTVIEGLGGIGKTQIALEAAYRVREKYPNCSVFWVPAVDKTTIDNAYRKIGQAMQIPGINDNRADIKALVRDVLSDEDTSPWLMVIDNADDMDVMFSEGDEPPFYDFLPSNTKGSILFTTRNHEVTVALDIGWDSTIPIGEMDQNEATQLLQKRLTKAQLRDEESTGKLLEFLAYLPLAIRQASAYMSRTGITPSTYLGYCESSDTSKIKILSQHFEDRSRYRYDKSANPIATTWLISFEHISKKYPLAAQYLKFIGYLAEKDIPTSLLPEIEDEIESNMAIGVLKNYAFITARDDSESFDIHRLVALAVRNWLKQEEADHIEEVTQHLSRIYPDPSIDNKDVWMAYLSHADAALDYWMRSSRNDAGWRLLINTGESHFILGKAQLAEMRYRQASEISEGVLGAEHPKTIASINGLSIMLRQQAKYPEAEQRQRQILEISIKMQGLEHPNTLAVMNGLAEVLRQSGRYPQAEKEQKQTVKLCTEVLGESHPNTLASMNNLIITSYQKGDFHQAEIECRQLIQKKIEALGDEHPDVLASMNSLAVILDLQGRYEESERQHRQTLQLISKVLGAEHPETMASVTNLASVLYRQGRYLEAEQQHRLAIEAVTRELHEGHPDALANTNGLAEVLRQQGKYQEAEQQLRQTLHFITKTLGPEHPSTLMVITNLGATLLHQGDCENAAKLFQQSLAVKTKVLGAEHPSTLTSISGLAQVLLLQKRYHEAEEQYQHILQQRTKLLGAQHPLTVTSMNHYATAHHLRRRSEEAPSTGLPAVSQETTTIHPDARTYNLVHL